MGVAMTKTQTDKLVDEMMALLDQATAALQNDDLNRALVLVAKAHVIADKLPKKEPPR